MAHDRGRAHASAHDVADDEGRAAAAEGDHVVPVAAHRGFRAARLVGRGDAQVVGLFEDLGQQGALEGDRGFALAAFAGAEAFGGFGVVGDVGGEDQYAAVLGVRDRGAGEGVGAAVGGLAGLDRAWLAAAQDLVEEREQAEFVEFREGLVGRVAEGAGAEGRHVGVVDVGEAVVGAVDEGDEGRDAVEDLADRQFVDGGHGQRLVGELLGAGGGHGALAPPVRGDRVGPRCGAALRSGEPGAPAREVHESLPRVVVFGQLRTRPGVWGWHPGVAALWVGLVGSKGEQVLVRGGGDQSGRVAGRADIRQTPGLTVEFPGSVRSTPSGRPRAYLMTFHRPRVRTPLGDVRAIRGRRSPA